MATPSKQFLGYASGPGGGVTTFRHSILFLVVILILLGYIS